MGRNFAGLGTTGQQNLMNQIDVFNRMGGVGRDIQDRMYGAQYGAARQMAQEPWKRMQGWQNMLGMLPQTLSRSTWNPMASNFDLFGGLASIYPQLGGLDKVLSAATGQDDNIISDLAIQERGAFGGG